MTTTTLQQKKQKKRTSSSLLFLAASLGCVLFGGTGGGRNYCDSGVLAFHHDYSSSTISASSSLQTTTAQQQQRASQGEQQSSSLPLGHHSFAFVPRSSSRSSRSSSNGISTKLWSTASSSDKKKKQDNDDKKIKRNNNNNNKNKKKRSPKYTTLEGLSQQVLQNTAKYLPSAKNNKNKKKKSNNRTRKRVENPQQTYIYAAQKKKQQQVDNNNDSVDSVTAAAAAAAALSSSPEQLLARELGMIMPASSLLHADALYGDEPTFMGRVRVLSSGGSSSPNVYAYIIDKPAGWCILGSKQQKQQGGSSSSSSITETTAAAAATDEDETNILQDNTKDSTKTRKQAPQQMSNKHVKQVVVKDKRTGEVEDVFEYNELDVFNLMTPEEINEFLEDGGELPEGFQFQKRSTTSSNGGGGGGSDEQSAMEELQFSAFDDDDDDDDDESHHHQDEMSDDDELVESTASILNAENIQTTTSSSSSSTTTMTSAATKERLQRIAARRQEQPTSIGGANQDMAAATVARFSSVAARRPSLISWLQDEFQTKGGTYWKAMAGATAVDDSGLVLLCPKSATDQVYFDSIDFLAVMMGNTGDAAAGAGAGAGGGHQLNHDNNNNNNNNKRNLIDGAEDATTATEVNVNTRARLLRNKEGTSSQIIKLQTLAKLRKGRGDDVVHTVRASTLERPVSCDDIVEACQKEYPGDCIRGDPVSHPLDRRARRRLVHCQQMSISSLLLEEESNVNKEEDEQQDKNVGTCQVESKTTPDDIAVFLDRQGRGQQSSLFRKGSFLGRSVLRNNKATTNAYREINGAADGHPGWIVDRYDKWLLVQHDPEAAAAAADSSLQSSSSELSSMGPLPSIHDGHTVGVYYMKSFKNQKPDPPVLLEGQHAPDLFPVHENGIQYLVSFRDLSTGIFLDQRPQRAWLAKNCCNETRVLNCFAHSGAYSVAAATAGASTVSLDLSQRWLDRLPQNLQANGIKFDERHDAIYGDCFDWLVRLAKRGETFDLVILDPPSTSVGGQKKKRWSVKNDMAELVRLALPLVKKGGVLWTTTNCATLSHMKFARLCHKGFDDDNDDDNDDAATKDTDGTSNDMKKNKKKTIARLERIQPMPSDFPTIGPQPVKNLVWRLI